MNVSYSLGRSEIVSGLLDTPSTTAGGWLRPDEGVIIDPVVLVYCGFIGAPGLDYGVMASRWTARNAYVTGWTESDERTSRDGRAGSDA